MKSVTAAKLVSALLMSSVIFLDSPVLADHSSGSGRESENESGRHGADDPANHDSPGATPTPVATTTPITSADGVFRARINSNVKVKHGIVSRVDLKSDLYVSIPSLSVGIATETDAETALVELSFSRGGVQYAICELELNRFERNRRVRFAQYRVDLRNEMKNGTLRTKLQRGSCDTDLATPGANNLAPDMNAGDVVQFSVNGQPISVIPEVRIR